MSRWVAPAIAIAACADPSAPEPPIPSPVPSEAVTIGVVRGGRRLEVRCSPSCAAIEGELERLAASCLRDPLSTPHATLAAPSAVALGCCEEAASAHREACGDETSARCSSGWRAACGAAALSSREGT
jgi:hypothetical protein